MTELYIYAAIIIILSLSDYYLTILSQKYYRKGLAKNISYESYEMNPHHRKAVKSKKLFSPKHLISLFIVALIVIISKNIVIANIIILFFVFLNLLHIKNLYIYYITFKNPEMVKGKVYYSNEFRLKTGIFNHLSLAAVIFASWFFIKNIYLIYAAAAFLLWSFSEIYYLIKKK